MEPEVLIGVLATALNVDQEEFTSALKDEEGNFIENAKDEILSQFSSHIQSVKSNSKEEGKGWGKREALKEFETSLRSEFKIESSELKGLDLVKSLVSSTASKQNQELADQLEELRKTKSFTDDDIKKSELYLNLEKAVQQSEQEKKNAVNEAVSNLEKQWKAKEVFGAVEKQARLYLDDQNVVLPEDSAKKERQITALLVSELAKYDYEVVGEGQNKTVFPIDKETGKRIENDLGHAKKVEALIQEITANNFEFLTSSKKEFRKPVDPKNPDGPKLPTTEDEYWDYIGNPEIPIKDRNRVNAMYDSGELKFE